jgi:hypothetical protein
MAQLVIRSSGWHQLPSSAGLSLIRVDPKRILILSYMTSISLGRILLVLTMVRQVLWRAKYATKFFSTVASCNVMYVGVSLHITSKCHSWIAKGSPELINNFTKQVLVLVKCLERSWWQGIGRSNSKKHMHWPQTNFDIHVFGIEFIIIVNCDAYHPHKN